MSRVKDINKLDLKGEHKKCSGKNCYTSQSKAEKAARDQEMLNWNTDLKLKTYICAECGMWHLTRSQLDNF